MAAVYQFVIESCYPFAPQSSFAGLVFPMRCSIRSLASDSFRSPSRSTSINCSTLSTNHLQTDNLSILYIGCTRKVNSVALAAFLATGFKIFNCSAFPKKFSCLFITKHPFLLLVNCPLTRLDPESTTQKSGLLTRRLKIKQICASCRTQDY